MAAFATYPLVTLMSMTYAVQSNLAALAGLRGKSLDELPCGRSTMPAFKQLVGWQALEQRQARYEANTPPP